MKVQFLLDYGKFKAGDVVEMSEKEAEDHHSAGRAQPYHAPAVEPVKKQAKPRRKSK